MKQPIQPLARDNQSGQLGFRGNAIVRYLFENSSFSLYQLMNLNVPADDQEQFAQLIGLAVADAQDWLSDETKAAVAQIDQTGISEQEARTNHLRERLEVVMASFRDPVSKLYDIPAEALMAR
jgi:hypothetical protein